MKHIHFFLKIKISASLKNIFSMNYSLKKIGSENLSDQIDQKTSSVFKTLIEFYFYIMGENKKSRHKTNEFFAFTYTDYRKIGSLLTQTENFCQTNSWSEDGKDIEEKLSS